MSTLLISRQLLSISSILWFSKKEDKLTSIACYFICCCCCCLFRVVCVIVISGILSPEQIPCGNVLVNKALTDSETWKSGKCEKVKAAEGYGTRPEHSCNTCTARAQSNPERPENPPIRSYGKVLAEGRDGCNSQHTQDQCHDGALSVAVSRCFHRSLKLLIITEHNQEHQPRSPHQAADPCNT